MNEKQAKVWALRYPDGTWFLRERCVGAGRPIALQDAKLFRLLSQARGAVTRSARGGGPKLDIVEFTLGDGVVLDESERVARIEVDHSTKAERDAARRAKRDLEHAQRQFAEAQAALNRARAATS